MGNHPSKTVNERQEDLKDEDKAKKGMEIEQNLSTAENIRILKEPLTKEDLHYISEKIKTLSFISDLPECTIDQLIHEFEKCQDTNQEWLFKQGSVAKHLFIIKEGNIDVVKDSFHTRSLGPGEVFGELALLYGIRRSSGIKISKQSLNRCTFYILSKQKFQKVREKANSTTSFSFLELMQEEPAFKCLLKRQLNSIALSVNKLIFYKNERILTRFDMPHALFIIAEGQVRLNYQGGTQILIGAKDYFGYYGLNQIEYSAVATEETTCYTIGRQWLLSILKDKIKSISLFTKLKNVLLLSPQLKQRLSTDQVTDLVERFTFKHVRAFEPLCQHKGEVDKIKVPLTCCQEHPIIGLIEILQGNRKYVKDYLTEKQGEYGEISANQFMKALNRTALKQNISVCQLFNGCDCQVLSSVVKPTGARSILCKESKQQIRFQLVEAQRNKAEDWKKLTRLLKILDGTTSNFLRSYHSYIEKPKYMTISLEFIPGAYIHEVVAEIGPLPLPIARFYLGILVIALEYLHSKNILFRNFHFQSFKVDRQGYLWLYDLMGCYELEHRQQRTDTVIGTSHWMPPEMIKRESYSFSVDFWGLGVLGYVITFGHYPFGRYQRIPYDIYKDILQEDLQFPINCRQKSVKQLFTVLLNKDAEVRQKLCWSAIKKMQFFRGLDWQRLKRKTLDSPYLPDLMKITNLF